jgi:23S rRNA pseudouridine1911/1915/1917 synthase
MAIERTETTVTPETAGRIDLIVRQLTGRSRTDLRGMFAHGCVTWNGSRCTEPGTAAAAGDVVAVAHDPHRRYHAPPPERGHSSLKIVFEDEHLIVVDKPAGILTVPTDHREKHTLVDVIGRHVRRRNARAVAGVVHRLDRMTSGLLVFGKSPHVTNLLQDQFRVRKAEREYVAIVVGRLPEANGTLTTQLTTTPSLQRRSVREEESGELAVTHYQVEEFLRGATLVRVHLETGRRNQIRVQFAEAGHPVLGDDRYEPKLAVHPVWKARRLALHACVLGFQHPVTGRALRFESPWPDDLQRFCERQRGRGR